MYVTGVSLMAQMVRNLPAIQDTQVLSLGWKDPLEKKMAIHCSILAWLRRSGRGAVGKPESGVTLKS